MRTLHHPTRDQLQLADVFHALADPVRLEMVGRLHRDGELPAGAFADIGLAKSTLSHHLKVLREAGVSFTRIKGTQHLVSLRETDLEVRFPGLVGVALTETR